MTIMWGFDVILSSHRLANDVPRLKNDIHNSMQTENTSKPHQEI